MGFVGFLLDPVDCLVRAGELADTAECSTIEIAQPAVGTTFRSIKFGNHNTPPVGFFTFLKNLIRAYLRTEIASLAPGLVYGEFHVEVLFVVVVLPT